MKKFFLFLKKVHSYCLRKTPTIQLYSNYFKDLIIFKKHSNAFNKKTLQQKEADLILNYHGLEKGMLYRTMKPAYAKARVKRLHQLLSDDEVKQNIAKSQIRTAYQLMCKYYELHQEHNYDISDFYRREQYLFYRDLLGKHYNKDFNGVVEWSNQQFFQHQQSNFLMFAHSRKSVREFTGEPIPIELLHQVVELANTAPSVCNRQASIVYLIEEKETIDKILEIQGGFTGYTENVNQLLILTNNLEYYYTVGERNQAYIDGGIYLMNLLYALHYYKINNCPVHWGKLHREDKRVRQIIPLPDAERIICMVPIGKPKEQFRTTLSQRRDSTENFHVIEAFKE